MKMTHSLDRRQLTAASFVTKGGVPADIGCDHAYLAGYLATVSCCQRVYACDVADGPLETARANVVAMGLQDKITLVKSDGLDSVPNDELSDVIICGMGGELILDILLRADWLKRGTNLVLQPMTRVPELRRGLYANGFEILAEKAVCDSKYAYTVINAKYTGSTKALGDLEAYVGKLDPGDPETFEYISAVATRLSESSLGKISSQNEATRLDGERELDLVHELFEIINEV